MLLVVDGHFAVGHERARGQLRDGGGQVSETVRVVAPTASTSGRAAVLVDDDPPAVHLLPVGPGGVLEGSRDPRTGCTRFARFAGRLTAVVCLA